jgi:thiosulfate dehydrogenase
MLWTYLGGTGLRRARLTLTVAVLSLLLFPMAPQTTYASERDEEYHRDYIYGAPADPSEAWTLASGARLYDNWISSLDAEAPEATHPAWPASNTKKKGKVTWRCKSCHGWDYAGKDGAYAKGSYKTGIKGVRAFAGKDPEVIHKIILNETHGFTHEMIPKDAMLRIAAFVSRGQIDVGQYVKPDKTVVGDAERGKAVFQNVCAACHGFDGKALNWGSEVKPKYVGSEAQSNPWEVLHKIRSGHPGVEMPAMMAFPTQSSIDLLAYTRTLPAK